jgi:uncharacterized protein (TIRG00374 family)
MLKLLVKFLVSVSMIAYLFSKADLNLVLERMKAADLWLVSLSLGLLFALVFPQALRWQKILDASGAHLKYTLAAGTTMVGWFFNQVLPTTVGGDAFRIWYAYRFGIRLRAATQSVIFDRLSALIAVSLILLLSSPWLKSVFSSDQPVFTVLIFSFVILAGCIVLLIADYLIPPFLPNSLKKQAVEFSGAARQVFLGRTGIKVVALSAAMHFAVASVVWLLAQSMQIQLNIVHVLLLMPVILLVTAIPISIAGWGVRESSMVVVFGMVGMPTESAISLSLSFGLVMLLASLPGGVAWWLMHHEVPQTE